MSIAALETKERRTHVGMGQIAFVERGQIARAVLGSCIGVAIYSPRLRVGALAHVVLPNVAGRGGPPGKFADVAVPHMIEELRLRGALKGDLVAKIAGGANMFGSAGPMQIGRDNAAAVRTTLVSMGVPILGEDVGGSQGRQIAFDVADGGLSIDTVAGHSVRL